jgi:hypothetical protein
MNSSQRRLLAFNTAKAAALATAAIAAETATAALEAATARQTAAAVAAERQRRQLENAKLEAQSNRVIATAARQRRDAAEAAAAKAEAKAKAIAKAKATRAARKNGSEPDVPFRPVTPGKGVAFPDTPVVPTARAASLALRDETADAVAKWLAANSAALTNAERVADNT